MKMTIVMLAVVAMIVVATTSTVMAMQLIGDDVGCVGNNHHSHVDPCRP